MNEDDLDRMKKLLQQALPPVKGDSEPRQDLWPAMLRRLNTRPAAQALTGRNWFDGALAFGLLGLAAFFPASIPVVLYYL
jgi:anti-sigma factor RsiW